MIDNAHTIRNWTLETDERDIAWLGIRTRGTANANVLSREVLLELEQILAAMEQAPPTGLVIYSHKESGFFAGADVREFPELKDAAFAYQEVLRGQQVLARLEALPFTTVAVLNGITLGGGLELALACDCRLSFPAERPTMGLPEVQLGVHPGLGGTVRLVRLIGVRAAMPMMLAGKSVRPAAALKAGLIDAICDPEQWRVEAATLATGSLPKRNIPWVDRLLNVSFVRPLLARTLVRRTRAKAKPEHYPAPYAVIDLWRRHGATDKGYDAEARSFAKLVFSPTSQNLQRVFFLQDRMKELAKASQTKFSHVHVVGAGTMGADIAAWCALQGMSVTLQDRDKTFVDAGLLKAAETLRRKLKTDERVAAASALLVGDSTGEGARSADLIIEAIFEDLTAKQELFSQLEQRARPEAVLASNTSSIPLEKIAIALQAPERLVGLHFFNPVALMPLVEVVQSEVTSSAAVADGLSFVKQIGKLPLPCKSLPGFLVNRILAPYLDEACRLYSEGLQPEAIDKAATDFGMPVGPLELADSVGLDILVHVADILGDTIGRPIPEALKSAVDEGRLGRKSGQGFYPWKNGKAVCQKAQRMPSGSDAQQRMIFSLLNEALACLAEGVVSDADLVDAGTIFGAGFAPFRGGPLHYLESAGITSMQSELETLRSRHGDRFSASDGWAQLLAKEIAKP